jgi:hypothetical protein
MIKPQGRVEDKCHLVPQFDSEVHSASFEKVICPVSFRNSVCPLPTAPCTPGEELGFQALAPEFLLEK